MLILLILLEVREGTNEQRELVHSLEKEVADAALRYTAVIQARAGLGSLRSDCRLPDYLFLVFCVIF